MEEGTAEDNIKDVPTQNAQDTPRVYYIGVLCPDRVMSIDCANSILNLKVQLEAQGHKVLWCFTNITKSPDNSKNILLSSFFSSGATHFIYWDSNYSCSPQEISKLIQANKPFISAPANSKNYHWGNLAEFAKKGGALQLNKIAPLITDYNINVRGADIDGVIISVGSAELPIYVCTREFLTELTRSCRGGKYEDSTYGEHINKWLYAFFETKIAYRGGAPAFISGDESFCDKIKNAGGEILIHTEVRCEAISKVSIASFLSESLATAKELSKEEKKEN